MMRQIFILALLAAIVPAVVSAQAAPDSALLRKLGARHQLFAVTDVAEVLLAAFLDTRRLLVPGHRIVVGPYRVSGDTVPHRWDNRDLGRILADTSVRLGDPTVRGWTLEGHPLPWSPGPGEVGVSFSRPEFRNDTARVLVYAAAGFEEGRSHALDRLTLVRRRGMWTVIRREQLMIS